MTKISVENQIGRFTTNFDGKSVSVWDEEEKQLVFSADVDVDQLELLNISLSGALTSYIKAAGRLHDE